MVSKQAPINSRPLDANGFFTSPWVQWFSQIVYSSINSVVASNEIPLMSSTLGAIGTSLAYAREDHKHPSDNSKLDASEAVKFALLAGADFTGLISAPFGWFGTRLNRTLFEADGTLKMEGDATVWNDWNLSRDFTPTAGAGVPPRNVLVGNIVKDQFAVNDALQYMSTELLHDWKEGSDMQIHIHWATGGLNDATVRGVKWEVEYTVCNPLESGISPTVFPATVTQSAEFSVPAAEPNRTHRVSTIYTIPGSTLKIGAQLLMRLKRIASVTNPAPAADPFVISFGVHFQSDTLGSRTVWGK
ncbi:MAG: hypothetical protein C0436_00540 [Alphaproteobacteria bacterium]|nr:hypothetical protein [Alphaproteobacteria bacterium]